MHRNILAAFASAALVVPALAGATSYELDPAHTNAQFAVKHMMVSTVRGQFNKVSGTVNLDDKDPSKSSIEATIDATTVNTRVQQRDDHLRSPDFLDVAKFPTITFKSTRVEATGQGTYKAHGDLTIHGVTKPVVLEVEAPAEEVKDLSGHTKRGATASTKISRKDFGLVWNKALEGGGVLVGDEVAITIDAELLKKADGATPAVQSAKGAAKK